MQLPDQDVCWDDRMLERIAVYLVPFFHSLSSSYWALLGKEQLNTLV